MRAPLLPRPYPEHHLAPLTDEQWRDIPVQWVPIHDLTPTQEAVSLEAIARQEVGDPREGGDFAGRAVVWGGLLCLHDGHTMWVRHLLRGIRDFPVRVVDTHAQPARWPA